MISIDNTQGGKYEAYEVISHRGGPNHHDNSNLCCFIRQLKTNAATICFLSGNYHPGLHHFVGIT
jgi:hypothetical protein